MFASIDCIAHITEASYWVIVFVTRNLTCSGKGHGPVIVKSVVIGSKGDWKLNTIFKFLSVSLLGCRMSGTSESVMVAYTIKYAKV